MSQLRELVLFRLRTFYREPGVLFWVFVFPILATVALGLAFRPGERGPLVAGVVGGKLPAAEGLASRAFDSEAAADRALGRGEIAVLVFLDKKQPRYRFDPQRPDSLAARLLVDSALQASHGQRSAIEATLEPVATPGRRYVDFLVPGLVGLQLMNTTLIGVGLSLIEMRGRRMLRRFAVTPVSRPTLLVAQVVSRLAFTWATAILTFGFARLAFDVKIQGSLLDVALLVLLGGFSFAGISLLLAAHTASQEVGQALVTLVAAPMVFLSGVFFSNSGFPIATGGLPAPVQAFAAFLPLTAFNDALRAIVNDGESLAAHPRELALLAAWGMAPLLAAAKWFRWT